MGEEAHGEPFWECGNPSCKRRDTTVVVENPDARLISWHCHECGETTTVERSEVGLPPARGPRSR